WDKEYECWWTALTRSRKRSSSPCSRKSRPRSARSVEAGVKSLSQPCRRVYEMRPVPSSRDVAQPGRALAWGARGRQFKSARPDQNKSKRYTHRLLRAEVYARGLEFAGTILR